MLLQDSARKRVAAVALRHFDGEQGKRIRVGEQPFDIVLVAQPAILTLRDRARPAGKRQRHGLRFDILYAHQKIVDFAGEMSVPS